MQPIETQYNGYLFRSRLEARWAVFFDALEIYYEYEPEGFKLSWEENGEIISRGYLPDLYLPEWDCWVEIKPGNSPKIDKDKWQNTLKILSVFSEEKNIMLLLGSPHNYSVTYLSPDRQIVGHFALGVKNTRELFISSQTDGIAICLNPLAESLGADNNKCTVNSGTLLNAYEKANQARFEPRKRSNPGRDIGWKDLSKTYLTGIIERITYFNEETGFTVGQMKTSDKADLVTIKVDFKNRLCAGDIIEAEGVWKKHPKFGEQFEVLRYHLQTSGLTYGIEKYLSSGLINGIGEVMAKRIVNRFGEKTFEILENNII